MAATARTRREVARRLAIRLSEYFARSGWDAVARPALDPWGVPSIEIRSPELDGVGAEGPAVIWAVDDRPVDRQADELAAWLRDRRRSGGGPRAFTTTPRRPVWCTAD